MPWIFNVKDTAVSSKRKKKGIIAKCRSIVYQPRFKLGCFILADINTFGNLHIERHQQTAVEPDSDVGYTVPVYDELFVRPGKISRIKGRHYLFQCPGIRVTGSVFQIDEGVFAGCCKSRKHPSG